MVIRDVTFFGTLGYVSRFQSIRLCLARFTWWFTPGSLFMIFSLLITLITSQATSLANLIIFSYFTIQHHQVIRNKCAFYLKAPIPSDASLANKSASHFKPSITSNVFFASHSLVEFERVQLHAKPLDARIFLFRQC